jgi:hypothetical protein
MSETHVGDTDANASFHDWSEASGIHELHAHGPNLHSEMQLPVYTPQVHTTMNQIQRLMHAVKDEGSTRISLIFKRADDTGKTVKCDGSEVFWSDAWGGWCANEWDTSDSCYHTIASALGSPIIVIPSANTVYGMAEEVALKLTLARQTDDEEEAEMAVRRALYLQNHVVQYIEKEVL